MPAWSYPWQRVVDPLAIPSGAMRHQIQIQAPTSTALADGQPSQTFAAFYTCFGAVDTKLERQVFQEGFVSQVVHKITIRWPGASVAINASHRVVVDATNVFEVQTVENVQNRNRVLVITCLELDEETVGS